MINIDDEYTVLIDKVKKENGKNTFMAQNMKKKI